MSSASGCFRGELVQFYVSISQKLEMFCTTFFLRYNWYTINLTSFSYNICICFVCINNKQNNEYIHHPPNFLMLLCDSPLPASHASLMARQSWICSSMQTLACIFQYFRKAMVGTVCLASFTQHNYFEIYSCHCPHQLVHSFSLLNGFPLKGYTRIYYFIYLLKDI